MKHQLTLFTLYGTILNLILKINFLITRCKTKISFGWSKVITNYTILSDYVFILSKRFPLFLQKSSGKNSSGILAEQTLNGWFGDDHKWDAALSTTLRPLFIIHSCVSIAHYRVARYTPLSFLRVARNNEERRARACGCLEKRRLLEGKANRRVFRVLFTSSIKQRPAPSVRVLRTLNFV